MPRALVWGPESNVEDCEHGNALERHYKDACKKKVEVVKRSIVRRRVQVDFPVQIGALTEEYTRFNRALW